MQRMFAIPTAKLLHLNSLSIVDLVLSRNVVAALTNFTCQCHLYPLLVLSHCIFSISLFLNLPYPRLVAAAGLEPATTRL